MKAPDLAVGFCIAIHSRSGGGVGGTVSGAWGRWEVATFRTIFFFFLIIYKFNFQLGFI